MSAGNEAIDPTGGNNNTDELHLRLSVSDANQILEALGRLPFAQVYALIAKIQNQAQEQLSGEHGPQEARLPLGED